MIVIQVDARLRVHGAPDPAVVQIREAFTHRNPEFGKQARFGGKVAKSIPKTIATWRDEADGSISVPRGGMGELRDILTTLGLPYRAEDKRANGYALEPNPEMMNVAEDVWERRRAERPLFFHQREIVRLAIAKENLLVRAPTGSGKTIAELATIIAAGRWALVMVPTVQLAKQWIREAAHELGLPEEWFGLLADGANRVGPITVGLPGSLESRIDSIASSFGTFIVDEVQRAAADTFGAIVDRMPARYRLGVSADERRADGKEFLIHDAFGDVELDVKREDLVLEGVILEVEVRMIPTAFDDPHYRAVKEREKAFLEKRREGAQISPFAAKKMKRDVLEAWDQLIAKMGADEERNAQIVELASAAAQESNPCLVFVHRREHAEILTSDMTAHLFGEKPASALCVGLMLGGKSSAKEFERTCDGIRNGSKMIGVGTYQAMGVGINLPAVSRGICATPVHTNRPFFGQVRGRICRRGSRDAVLWVLWDERVFGVGPLESMVKWNPVVRVLRDGNWIDGKSELAKLRGRA